jgi:hypothetical protein
VCVWGGGYERERERERERDRERLCVRDERAHTHRDKERDARTAGGVLRTNAFDDDEGFANLYEITSRVNHACEPRLAGYRFSSTNCYIGLRDHVARQSRV